jgi:putative ABC transport system permease protein
MGKHASFWEAVTGALQSLRSSKLRSFLTLLGIILATTTLIAVMSVISGMDVYIAQNVSNMGADGYRVTRIVMMQWDPKKFLEMQRRNPQLKLEEYNFLRANATLSKDVGAVSNRSVSIHLGKETSEGVTLMGVTTNIGVILDFEPVEGRFIGETEDRRGMNVAFIGNDIKTKFFPGSDPVGQSISLEGLPFQIVGVAKAKGSVFGNSQDNFVIIPINTLVKIWGGHNGMDYAATAIDHEHLAAAQDEAKVLLRSYRHLGPKDDDTFSMLTSDALVSFWNQLTGAISATAVGVVSVFMVVGGVVIMNIMLAVVTERTHEIGIRKSVGARKQDILSQFLVESAMLAGIGGLMGVIVAWLVAVAVRSFTPVPMSVPVSAVIIGVALSATVGLFFGIYPAQRAARLDPIEALRVEK